MLDIHLLAPIVVVCLIFERNYRTVSTVGVSFHILPSNI